MALFKDLSLNPDQVNAYAQKIAPLKPFLRKKERDYHMKLHLQGVYIVEEDWRFFSLVFPIPLRIDYRNDQLRYTVKERKLAQLQRNAKRKKCLCSTGLNRVRV